MKAGHTDLGSLLDQLDPHAPLAERVPAVMAVGAFMGAFSDILLFSLGR